MDESKFILEQRGVALSVLNRLLLHNYKIPKRTAVERRPFGYENGSFAQKAAAYGGHFFHGQYTNVNKSLRKD